MGIAITFRHMDSTEALKNRVHEKLERVQKYLRAPLDAHVTLFQERHEFVAELLIQAAGHTYQARHDSDDLYKSIEIAVDKVAHQIQKTHDTLARNKKGGPPAAEVALHANHEEPDKS